MSVHKPSASTFGRARLSFASEADIDEFASVLGQFERGEITPEQWRVFRLVRGTYGQRQADDAQMIRVKIPQGALSAEQLQALADVAEQYSRGFGHITTRQNVQLHFVKLHDVEPAMRRLAEAGLTTREACGNSVRNITACQFAGVAPDEAFDVTPYAEALTRFLLRHPLSSSLPRKFKIAFEGCAARSHQADHQRHRLARARAARSAWFPRPHRRRHLDDDDGGNSAVRFPAGDGDVECCRGDDSRLPCARRLPAQAAQPDEVPDQVDGMGSVSRGIRRRARG